MAIRCRLPEIRARHGRMSLRELSERTGIAAANLSRLDSGKTTRIDFGTLDKLCRFFGVTPGDMLERVEDAPSDELAWTAAGHQDARRGIAAAEASLPPAEVRNWLETMDAAAVSVEWDEQRGEFVEVES